MESGVKYENLGLVGHSRGTACDTHKVRGCVKRSEVIAELQLLNNLVGYKCGLKEVGAAMDNSVSDSTDLVHALDAAVLVAHKSLDYSLHSKLVVGHIDLSLIGNTL